MEIKEQIRTLAKDLTNLEIITIVKPNITGRKMPDPTTALKNICDKYSIKLRDLGAEIPEDENWGSKETFQKIESNSTSKIEELKKEIKELEKVGDVLPPARKADLWMLYRIKTMTQAILQRYENNGNEIPPTADNLTLIRKSWELGIEEIAMKTVVQLDGDIITRVQEKYITEEYATIHKLHHIGVDKSFAFWKMLADILESLVTGLVKLIFPTR